jgi:hypothetical protein
VKQVLEHIKKDFRRLDMNLYGIKEESKLIETREIDLLNFKFPVCGTKACFAGWTVLQATPKKKWGTLFTKTGLMRSSTHNKAARLLGLTYSESYDIFQGGGLIGHTPQQQFKYLKQDINNLFESRRIKERV